MTKSGSGGPKKKGYEPKRPMSEASKAAVARVFERMDELNVSNRLLAERSGLPLGKFTKWSSHYGEVWVGDLTAVAKVLGRPVAWFLGMDAAAAPAARLDPKNQMEEFFLNRTLRGDAALTLDEATEAVEQYRARKAVEAGGPKSTVSHRPADVDEKNSAPLPPRRRAGRRRKPSPGSDD